MMAISALFLTTTASTPPRSLVPLTEKLPTDDGVHPAARHPRRRRLEALTRENTEPIRLVLDGASLDEATAPKYSACFREGDWFMRGLPGPNPPATKAEATCLRGPDEWQVQDCWGVCTERDVVTPAVRDQVLAIAADVMEELVTYFAVRKFPSVDADGDGVADGLTFVSSKGSYARALESKGYTPVESCANDCTMLSGVAVADKYCAEGVQADAVVSIVKPPEMYGVGGTGGACAHDTQGRPTWLVFSWIQVVDPSRTIEENTATFRGLVLHELIHALGFTNSQARAILGAHFGAQFSARNLGAQFSDALGFTNAQFNNARDGAGERKNLIEMLPVTNDDDNVWHFTKGRAWSTAKQYFGCYDDSKWQGLPLMGLPDLGRASHWETRVMRDDVMSCAARAIRILAQFFGAIRCNSRDARLSSAGTAGGRRSRRSLWR